MKKKILVVEDHGDLQEIIKNVLEDKGFEVFNAYDGLQALELLEIKKFDLMITDYRMPRMTGAELIIRVRSLYPSLPVILSSSYLPWQIGLDDLKHYLTKPYDLGQLFKKVHLILGPHKDISPL